MAEQDIASANDWVVDRFKYFWLWGLPTILLIGVIFLSHPIKTWVWSFCLIWKGGACLVNAQRCGRRHCFYTGPFFIFMAIAGLLHGYKIVWLGESGWAWLYVVLIGIGGGVFWFLFERVWGKYR